MCTRDGSTWDSTGATPSVTSDAAHCERALRLETGDYRGISQRFDSDLLVPGATLEVTGKARWQIGASGRPGLAAYFLLDGGGEFRLEVAP